MAESDAPILEHDGDGEAVIEPGRVLARRDDVPEHVVLCFLLDVVERVAGEGRLLHSHYTEAGPRLFREIEFGGRRLGVLNPGIGAPIAAGLLEEVIALGGRKFVACGSAGVLDPTLEVGRFVAVRSAVRDEGTSYHYLPAAREVEADPAGVEALETVLRRGGHPHVVGKTWTTDGFYRETAVRVARRRAEGCVTVEMEAAALLAVARFRSVVLSALLYAGDDVSGEDWDPRERRPRAARDALFEIAAEACLAL